MRILLVALNAKYVHTNLAVRYLREGVIDEFPESRIREFTINEPIDRIEEEIFAAGADVIGFSCYIWNRRETLELVRRLRLVCPRVRIVLGGPEVSFGPDELLEREPGVDAVVAGEGEITFLELLRAWNAGTDLSRVDGLCWREDGHIRLNPPRPVIEELDRLPFPYREKEDFTGRLVYVETSRGCPFCCAYCLSSVTAGVRFLTPELLRRTLRILIAGGADTVKFVDRTFNADKAHAFAVLDIVKEEAARLDGRRNFRVHCEIAGELLDEEWLSYLSRYPDGLLQLEVGVQSTHRETLKKIGRVQHFERWERYIRELKKMGHIPLHLDLIAGLPGENRDSFKKSFNDVYAVRPDMFQLGFLKLLRGSRLRAQSADYGLIYAPDPPYTVLSSDGLSHGELIRLSQIERLLDRYYNSGKFAVSLPRMVAHFAGPFDFFDRLAAFWQEKGWFRQAWQGKALLEKLWEFLGAEVEKETRRGGEEADESELDEWREALRFDFYLWEKPGFVPPFLKPSGPEPPGGKARDEEVRYDPQWEERIPFYSELDRRQWSRITAVANFAYDVFSGAKGETRYLFTYRGTPRAFRFEEDGGKKAGPGRRLNQLRSRN